VHIEAGCGLLACTAPGRQKLAEFSRLVGENFKIDAAADAWGFDDDIEIKLTPAVLSQGAPGDAAP